ncbi:isoprenylcysteine carboxyl methyltransferase family protein [Blastococcus sp. Marseille-P5729]|uniref:isoprenylcysteine carboxyl methyltransferase family protein n=1 Tax=Blastococcus sp. Marseille-P5729 TaxID=2086582 RepID=UPI001F46FF50|nr:isoprenylcysteine carboxyl methyltransferase family protein [Blastococcus sp. Marseille-P5729]
MSAWLFTGLIVLVGLERLAELMVSKRNAAWSFARGGYEVGRGHYPFMVVLHTGFLVAAVLEVWLLDRSFHWWGWIALLIVVLSQALRWWCIATLGHQWNTRVIIVPGARRVVGGPYRWMPHPNYVAVVAEGIALPMVHNAWLTALGFTVLNAALLTVRIRTENQALSALSTT